MFSELAEPRIRIDTSASQASRQALLSPVVSWPTTSTTGPVRSVARTSTAPASSSPSTRWPVERTWSSTSRCEGARTTVRANSEPVLARTARGS